MPHFAVPSHLVKRAHGKQILHAEGRTVGAALTWLQKTYPDLAGVWIAADGRPKPLLAAQIKPENGKTFQPLGGIGFEDDRRLGNGDVLTFATPRKLHAIKFGVLIGGALAALIALILFSAGVDTESPAAAVMDVAVFVAALGTTAVLGLCRVNLFSTLMIVLLIGVFGGMMLSQGPTFAGYHDGLLCPPDYPHLEQETETSEPRPGERVTEVITWCADDAGERIRVSSIEVVGIYAAVNGVVVVLLVVLFRLLRRWLVRRLGPASEDIFLLF